MGEPAGIGPEVAVAAFDHFGGQIGGRPLKLVGDPDVFVSHRQALIPTNARARRTPGQPDAANAPAVIEAIEVAVQAAMAGEAALVDVVHDQLWCQCLRYRAGSSLSGCCRSTSSR